MENFKNHTKELIQVFWRHWWDEGGLEEKRGEERGKEGTLSFHILLSFRKSEIQAREMIHPSKARLKTKNLKIKYATSQVVFF